MSVVRRQTKSGTCVDETDLTITLDEAPLANSTMILSLAHAVANTEIIESISQDGAIWVKREVAKAAGAQRVLEVWDAIRIGPSAGETVTVHFANPRDANYILLECTGIANCVKNSADGNWGGDPFISPSPGVDFNGTVPFLALAFYVIDYNLAITWDGLYHNILTVQAADGLVEEVMNEYNEPPDVSVPFLSDGGENLSDPPTAWMSVLVTYDGIVSKSASEASSASDAFAVKGKLALSEDPSATDQARGLRKLSQDESLTGSDNVQSAFFNLLSELGLSSDTISDLIGKISLSESPNALASISIKSSGGEGGSVTLPKRYATEVNDDSSLGDSEWTDPANAENEPDDVAASVALNDSSLRYSHLLVGTGFDFSDIPEGASITAINIYFVAGGLSPGGENFDGHLMLWNGGSLGDDVATQSVAFDEVGDGSLGEIEIDHVMADYGTSLTGADLQDAEFGVALSLWCSGDSSTMYVDSIALEVTYETAGGPTEILLEENALATEAPPEIVGRLTMSELGEIAESLSMIIRTSSADEGSADDEPSLKARIGLSEDANSNELAAAFVKFALGDAAAAGEMISLAVKIALVEQAAAGDISSVLTPVFVAEPLTGLEALKFVMRLSKSDAALGLDNVETLARLSVADPAVATELLRLIGKYALGESGIPEESVAILVSAFLPLVPRRIFASPKGRTGRSKGEPEGASAARRKLKSKPRDEGESLPPEKGESVP